MTNAENIHTMICDILARKNSRQSLSKGQIDCIKTSKTSRHTEITKRIDAYNKEIETIKEIQPNSFEDIKHYLEHKKRIQYVTVRDKKLYIETHPVVARSIDGDENNYPVFLGSYAIDICLESPCDRRIESFTRGDVITIDALTYTHIIGSYIKNNLETYDHNTYYIAPHIRENGPCYGSAEYRLDIAYRTKNIIGLIITLLDYLESYNPEDSWGENYCLWPNILDITHLKFRHHPIPHNLVIHETTPDILPNDQKTHLFLDQDTTTQDYTDLLFTEKDYYDKTLDILASINPTEHGGYIIRNKQTEDCKNELIEKAHAFCKPKIGNISDLHTYFTDRHSSKNTLLDEVYGDIRCLQRELTDCLEEHKDYDHKTLTQHETYQKLQTLATTKNHPLCAKVSFKTSPYHLDIIFHIKDHPDINTITFHTTHHLTPELNAGYTILSKNNGTIPCQDTESQRFVENFLKRSTIDLSKLRHILNLYTAQDL